MIIINNFEKFVLKKRSIWFHIIVGYFTAFTWNIIWLITYILYNKKIKSNKHSRFIDLSRNTQNRPATDLEQYKKSNEIPSIEHINNRKKEYIQALNSIKILVPTVYKTAQNKNNLAEMPYLNFSQIRKNTPQDRLEKFVSIDIETTGLHPGVDEILEISAIKFIDSEPIECLTTLIKPKKDIPANITNINHITNEMVANSPNIEFVIQDFSKFIKGFNVVGYNLEFDLRFLYKNGLDLFNEKRQFYDAIDLARKVYKNKLYNFKLDSIAEEMELYRTQSHRATEDAFVTGIIFRDLGTYIKK